MNPLALCHFTLVEAEPPAFVDIAAQAGFTAVSLMIQFPRSNGPGFPMAGDTRMRRETRRLVLYRAINLAHIVFGPLIEQMLGLSLTDPVVLERFRDAAVDLPTHPVFNEAPTNGDASRADGP